MMILVLRKTFFSYFPSEGRRAADFYRLKNPSPSAGFEPANLGCYGMHANDYTIEDGSSYVTYYCQQNVKNSQCLNFKSCIRIPSIIFYIFEVPSDINDHKSTWQLRSVPMAFNIQETTLLNLLYIFWSLRDWQFIVQWTSALRDQTVLPEFVSLFLKIKKKTTNKAVMW
jgi:hypothetical protein